MKRILSILTLFSLFFSYSSIFAQSVDELVTYSSASNTSITCSKSLLETEESTSTETTPQTPNCVVWSPTNSSTTEPENIDGIEVLGFLNARYYDANRGQFTSQDPVFWEVGLSKDGQEALLNPQSQNSYSYANNNPINSKDPSGRASTLALENCKNSSGCMEGVQSFFDELGKLGANLTPLLGNAISYENAKTGTDIFTGEQLSGTQRTIEAVSAIPLVGYVGKGAKVEKAIWSATKDRTAVQNALKHFNDHGAEFEGIQNAKQYVEMAREFFTKKSDDILTKVRANGDKLYYDIKQNIYGSTKADGTPKTIFKPEKGIEYWNNQK